uniref:Src kinase associated phosphoprotein 1 n=1 Tax=Coturnix japonica TaxID=93934 RepID=A0A8C2UCT1_COTJA
MIPEDIQRLLADAECFLVDGLQNENLSPKAREQRNTILFGFQQAKARYHLEFLPRGETQHDAGFGQDSSDDNQSWSLAPSVTSDVPMPSDLQDDGVPVEAECPLEEALHAAPYCQLLQHPFKCDCISLSDLENRSG